MKNIKKRYVYLVLIAAVFIFVVALFMIGSAENSQDLTSVFDLASALVLFVIAIMLALREEK